MDAKADRLESRCRHQKFLLRMSSARWLYVAAELQGERGDAFDASALKNGLSLRLIRTAYLLNSRTYQPKMEAPMGRPPEPFHSVNWDFLSESAKIDVMHA